MKVFPGIVWVLAMTAAVACGAEVYFSPNGGVQSQIVKRIRRSQTTIDIAVYSFTAPEIEAALAEAHRRGVRIRVLRDVSQSSDQNDQNEALNGEHIPVQLQKGLGRGIMHDKFILFDGNEGMTGSYNLTENAEHQNHENAFFFTDPAAIHDYQTQFDRLWALPPAEESAAHGRHERSSWHRVVRYRPGVMSDHPTWSLIGAFLVGLAIGLSFT